ncbi:Protein phosphatase Slingshot 3, partial [Eschrichtius robustus]|nr:Protein phosphatase Slingshot 3 [Eschrichtius robustus]
MEEAIRAELWEVLDSSDLESITSKEIRQALELRLGRPLQRYRDFVDNQMLLLVAQQDRASRIFPHLYLGSEWNAANLEELQRNRVSHILNMAREIDNFYPERFTYHNVRLWDEESAQLLSHWKETHCFVEAARAQGTRVLVHCKMGVSRSAATVIAYAMKQYGWSLEQALRHVQELRPIARPNPGFLRQLQTYQGILTASAKGGQQAREGPWPALKSRQSVVALNNAALVASRTRAFQEQRKAGCPSTPRHQKVVRQASVDDSGEEGEV